MLLKPSFAIPHGGGRRFSKDSLEYRVIAEWIAAGAPPPTDQDAHRSRPGGVPGGRRAGARRGTAACGAGEVLGRPRRDVTRWVRFASADEGVATVDDWGRVKMNGGGERQSPWPSPAGC